MAHYHAAFASQYDVFLSHNRAQKDWTRQLARRLRDAGFRVWFDEWCLRGGENWIVGLRRGVNESRHVVCVTSPEFFANQWPRFEMYVAILDDPADGERKLVPVFHAPCDLPPPSWPSARELISPTPTPTPPATSSAWRN